MTVILQPTCLKCLDVALSLRPEHTAALHLLQQFFLEGPGAADPTFKQEFTIGLKLVDQVRRPQFNPSSNVSTSNVYGCRFVQTFGVLTKAEYSKLTGKDPGQISKVLNPVSWAWTNPSTAATYYLIDLTDLPSGLAQGIQRVEVFSEQLTSLEELFLSADCQITKNQGRHVFTSILSSSMAKRPTELHPGARKPMTLEELKAKHEQAEAETPLPADSAAAASSAGLDLPAEHHAVGIDLDAVQGVKNKTRRRKKVAATSIQDLLLADSFMESLAKCGQGSDQSHIVAMVCDLCGGLLRSEAAWKEVTEHWQLHAPVLEPVAKALDDCFSVCRCLLTLLGAGDDEATAGLAGLQGAQAVQTVLNYKGKDVLLRAYRAMLVKPASFGEAQVREVQRTAGSSEALKPEVAEVQDLLTRLELVDGQPAAEDLESILEKMQKLRAGLRESRLQPLEERVKSMVDATARCCMGIASGVDNRTVASVDAMLTFYSKVPGFLSLQNDFQEWANAMRMHNRAGVFLECLQKACRNNGCDFDTLAKNLPAEPLVLGSAGYDTIVEATGHCLLEVYHFIIDKVCVQKSPLAEHSKNLNLLPCSTTGSQSCVALVTGRAGENLFKSLRVTIERINSASSCLKIIVDKFAGSGVMNKMPPSVRHLVDMRLSELLGITGSRTCYEECVVFKCTDFTGKLQQCLTRAVALSKGFQEGGGNPWKASLTATSTLAEVFEAADSILGGLDGKELRRACEQSIQELENAKDFIKAFSKGMPFEEAKEALDLLANQIEAQSPKHSKLLLTESFLAHACKKLASGPDEKMMQLLSQEQGFLLSNQLGLSENDLPAALREAMKQHLA
ncbi:unnamed protein product [Symbiodinium microadriaticum]|nr:unnamed protein product [Symbiodinium microadriaticum]